MFFLPSSAASTLHGTCENSVAFILVIGSVGSRSSRRCNSLHGTLLLLTHQASDSINMIGKQFVLAGRVTEAPITELIGRSQVIVFRN
jgi:hypothetical protein